MIRPLLALLLAFGSALAVPAATETAIVNVTLADFSFTPATLNFERGRHYRLHLENQGSGGHNFSGAAFFKAVSLDTASQSLVNKGKVEVPKGGSVDLDFTVVTPGTYPIKCTHFLHAGFGMTGSAIIN